MVLSGFNMSQDIKRSQDPWTIPFDPRVCWRLQNSEAADDATTLHFFEGRWTVDVDLRCLFLRKAKHRALANTLNHGYSQGSKQSLQKQWSKVWACRWPYPNLCFFVFRHASTLSSWSICSIDIVGITWWYLVFVIQLNLYRNNHTAVTLT